MSNKIDSLVAERVMQWTRRLNADVHDIDRDPNNSDHDWLGTLSNHWWSKDAKPKQMGYVEDEGLCREDFEKGWSPSTDISAAWDVVEKMRADGWGYELFNMMHSTQHEATFAHESDRTKDVAAETDSPTLSICLAALRAVGVDEATIQEAMK